MIQTSAILFGALGLLGTVADSSGLAGLGAAGAGGIIWYLSTRMDRLTDKLDKVAERVAKLERQN